MGLIGLISDTHDNVSAIERAVKLFNEKRVKLVVHAGDWCAPFSLMRFQALNCSLVGAFGNIDGEKEKLKDMGEKLGFRLNWFEEFEVDGLKGAVLHGVDERIVKALALSGLYKVVVRGHTHKSGVDKVEGCIVVNPGEACGYLTGKETVAILDAKTLKVEFLEL